MQEKTLMKISFICSVIGIIALYFVSESIVIPDTAIGRIDLSTIGKTVKVDGTVGRVNEGDKVIIFGIKDNKGDDELTVIAFKNKNSDDSTQIASGAELSITGKIEEYNGKPEIIASEIIANKNI